MINIVVNYAYQTLGAAALEEDQKWGFGKMHMVSERWPETDEELKEVARTIGLEGKYEAVAIQTINPVDKLIDNSDIVIEGTIVDDAE